jgi:hypothetical protein
MPWRRNLRAAYCGEGGAKKRKPGPDLGMFKHQKMVIYGIVRGVFNHQRLDFIGYDWGVMVVIGPVISS